MQFLNPSLLIGLVAASIPLLLHLLNLRRLKRIEFSSVVFLKELKKSRIRNVKLRQLLLLILRTLIIASIVFAFARPAIDSNLPGVVAHAPTSVVYILDNTFSMDVEDDQGVRFTQLKRFVRESLGQLKQGDEVSFVLLSDPYDSRLHGPTRNPEVAKEWAQKLQISHSPPQMSLALEVSKDLLEAAGNINREIIVVTDAQQNVVPGNDITQDVSTGVAVYVKSFDESEAGLQNLSVDSVYLPTLMLRPGVAQEMVAGVRNDGDSEFAGAVVSVFNGDRRVAQQSVDIAANTTAYLTFVVTPTDAGESAFKVVVEGDGLVHDNTRYAHCLVPSFPNVLLVESERTEVSYLQTAMLADGRDPNSVDVVAPSEIGAFALTDYDVIVLRDVVLSSQQHREIATFVELGGGLLTFLGENTAVSEDMQTMLGSFGIAAYERESFLDPMTFTAVDKKHPLFSGVFKGNSSVVNEDPSLSSAVLFTDNEVLSVGRKSLLATGTRGKGQVLAFGFPADGSWSRLPFTGLFVSMVNRGLATVTSSPDVTFEFQVGEPMRLQLPHGIVDSEITEVRDGMKATRQVSQLSTGTYVVLPAAKTPGAISLQNDQGETIAVLNVNPDRNESRISQDNSELLVEAISPWFEPGAVLALDANHSSSASVRTKRAGTELWSWFLGFALLCALAEMTIASRWK